MSEQKEKPCKDCGNKIIDWYWKDNSKEDEPVCIDCLSKWLDDEKIICRRIGLINRFEEKMELTCREYNNTDHKRKHNPDFNINDWCKVCKTKEIIQFNELLEKTIKIFPNEHRYCCIRKMPVTIETLRNFNCRTCSMFVLNENEDSICDPL